MNTSTRCVWAAGLAFVVMFGCAAVLRAQPGPGPYEKPQETVSRCDADVTAELVGEVNGTVTLSGTAGFRHVANAPASDPLRYTELLPDDIDHSGTDPALGTFTLTADIDRSTAVSRIEAQNESDPMPAKGTLRFHATLTSSAHPGVTYRSLTEIVIEDPNLTVWPHQGAIYTQVGVTQFDRADAPGVPVLTLQNASVTVTAAEN